LRNPSIGSAQWASLRLSNIAPDGITTRGCSRCETRAKAGLLFVVMNDFGKELTACCRYEPGVFQRDKCLASAKTSSAA
jgi:hypothetical protein